MLASGFINTNKIMSKYPGYNENDTKYDAHHKSTGQMTNREFFKSNAKGGFYEGMEWDGDEWVLNAENQRKEDAKQYDLTCGWCGEQHCGC